MEADGVLGPFLLTPHNNRVIPNSRIHRNKRRTRNNGPQKRAPPKRIYFRGHVPHSEKYFTFVWNRFSRSVVAHALNAEAVSRLLRIGNRGRGAGAGRPAGDQIYIFLSVTFIIIKLQLNLDFEI